jgi:subtilase family serine protease
VATFVRSVESLASFTLLLLCMSPNVSAENWASTATQAYPAKYLQKAVLVGSLAPSTPLHIVVGLKEQNASQVQPTLRAMLTPGSSLYGTSFTVSQFVQNFGATSAQVQSVTQYLSSEGFTNVTAAANQLLIEADGTAKVAEAAFNTSLQQYSVNGAIVYLNSTAAQVPSSLSGIVIAVLGLNNVAQMHTDIRTLHTGPQTVPCTPPECPTPDLSNESYSAQQYQIAYDAACPSDNANCPAKNFTSGKSTAVGIIAEGDLTQVVID